jgi:hypothetical protein
MREYGRILVVVNAVALTLLQSCRHEPKVEPPTVTTTTIRHTTTTRRPTPKTTTTTTRPTSTLESTTSTTPPPTTAHTVPESHARFGPHLVGHTMSQVIEQFGEPGSETKGPGLFRMTAHYKGLGRVQYGRTWKKVLTVELDPNETGKP